MPSISLGKYSCVLRDIPLLTSLQVKWEGRLFLRGILIGMEGLF